MRAKNDVVRTDIRSAQKFLEQNLSTPNKQQSTDTAAPAAAVDNDVRTQMMHTMETQTDDSECGFRTESRIFLYLH